MYHQWFNLTKICIHTLNGKTVLFLSIKFVYTQFKCQTLLVEKMIDPFQVLPIRVRVELWAKVLKGYYAFPKAPVLLCFDPSTQPKNAIPRWYTGRKWHTPMASNRKRSRWRIKAYDMGQGEGPIVPLTVMHRKRVTSGLHDSYSRLMTIKHPIQRSSSWSCGRWVII